VKRLLNPFVLALTAILAVAYAYLAWRLARGAPAARGGAAPAVETWGGAGV
jgi:hypothetical protein